ncbi:MAG: DUF4158 domain-containing protein [Actinobacteria bacterium]|nr:DUF4158 domain-containing protein [Actinomycetota bacterium]
MAAASGGKMLGVGRAMDLGELVEHWTVLEDEHALVSGKRGATRIGFAMLLKFYIGHGRFADGVADLPGEAVKFVARQIGCEPWELDAYEWSGRTIEYHRSQIREHLGFRECSVQDADDLIAWLAADVCQVERRPERVRELMLARCRAVCINPPARGRIDRIVRSALHQGELALPAALLEGSPRIRRPGFAR